MLQLDSHVPHLLEVLVIFGTICLLASLKLLVSLFHDIFWNFTNVESGPLLPRLGFLDPKHFWVVVSHHFHFVRLIKLTV